MLAIEATDRGGSIALASSDRLLDLNFEDSDRTHSERIMPQIDDLLDKRDLGYESIDSIAVATGPGSFTAIRLAVTSAKTLAMVCDASAVGVSTLRTLAEYYSGSKGRIFSVIDARRGEYYVQEFVFENSKINNDTSPELLDPDALRDRLRGDGSTTVILRERDQGLDLESLTNEVVRYDGPETRPLSAALISVARTRLDNGDEDDPDRLSPTYVRQSDAQRENT